MNERVYLHLTSIWREHLKHFSELTTCKHAITAYIAINKYFKSDTCIQLNKAIATNPNA